MKDKGWCSVDSDGLGAANQAGAKFVDNLAHESSMGVADKVWTVFSQNERVQDKSWKTAWL